MARALSLREVQVLFDKDMDDTFWHIGYVDPSNDQGKKMATLDLLNTGKVFFINEHGRESGEHGEWWMTFDENTHEIRLEIRHFHCCGEYGIRNHWSKSMTFRIFLVSRTDNRLKGVQLNPQYGFWPVKLYGFCGPAASRSSIIGAEVNSGVPVVDTNSVTSSDSDWTNINVPTDELQLEELD